MPCHVSSVITLPDADIWSCLAAADDFGFAPATAERAAHLRREQSHTRCHMTGATDEIDRHVTRRYEVVQKLGKGAYGIVWRAMDKKTKDVVALKKIFDAFQNATDAQRTYREVVFLQEMRGHDHIISLINVMKAENDKDLYLVFEFMETDLNAAIKANILQEIHKQYIIYQCFAALRCAPP